MQRERERESNAQRERKQIRQREKSERNEYSKWRGGVKRGGERDIAKEQMGEGLNEK